MALDGAEKRKFPRLSLRVPISYQVRGAPESRGTISENISAGGLCVCSNEFLTPQALLMLEINLLSHVIRPIGRVAWTSSVAHSDRCNAGIEFIEMSQQDGNYLQDYVSMQEGKL